MIEPCSALIGGQLLRGLRGVLLLSVRCIGVGKRRMLGGQIH
jgi:hypothetical protein